MLEQILPIVLIYLLGFTCVSFVGISYNIINKPWHFFIAFITWFVFVALFNCAIIFIAGKHIGDWIEDWIARN